jgi:hypothetical protein
MDRLIIPMNVIYKLLFGFLLPISLAYAETDPVITLNKNEGLLLVKLDIEPDLAIISIQKLGQRSTTSNIKLVPTHGKWLIKTLTKGDYQIIDIKVPYFNLPFVKSTEKKPAWKFTVADKKLNYIGEIKIEKERTEDFVNIHKYFRPAFHLTQIQQEFPHLLSQYPLVSGNSLRDDFVDSFIIEGETQDD